MSDILELVVIVVGCSYLWGYWERGIKLLLCWRGSEGRVVVGFVPISCPYRDERSYQ